MLPQQKALGFWTVTAFVTGSIIGSGIFLLPASLANYGTIGIGAWIFNAFGSLCLGFIFATLAHLEPQLKGPYAYCREAFGNFVGFIVAYSYWIMLWANTAAIIIVLIGYLEFFWPALSHHHLWSFMAGLIVLWTLSLINISGVKQAGFIQLITTVLKTIPLLLIAIIGLFFIHPQLLTHINVSHHSTLQAFNQTMVLTFWSFLGMEFATVLSREVKEPSKTIPRATMIGILLAAVIYIAITVVVMGIIPLPVLAKSHSPIADVARIILGPWAGFAIASCAVISILGALNGLILVQSQILSAASEDRLLPAFFRKLSKRNTPFISIIFNSTLVSLLLLTSFKKEIASQFILIISIGILSVLIPYLFSTMAEVLMAFKHRTALTKNKIIKMVIMSLLSFGYIMWMMIGSNQAIVFYGFIVLLFAIPCYTFICLSQKNQSNE